MVALKLKVEIGPGQEARPVGTPLYLCRRAERCEGNISLDSIGKLANALGVQAGVLLGNLTK